MNHRRLVQYDTQVFSSLIPLLKTRRSQGGSTKNAIDNDFRVPIDMNRIQSHQSQRESIRQNLFFLSIPYRNPILRKSSWSKIHFWRTWQQSYYQKEWHLTNKTSNVTVRKFSCSEFETEIASRKRSRNCVSKTVPEIKLEEGHFLQSWKQRFYSDALQIHPFWTLTFHYLK